MQNSIYSYIRDDNGHRIGLFYGEKGEDGIVRIGYSRVNLKEGDIFDLAKGLEIAKGRLGVNVSEIPFQYFSYYMSFMSRCWSFFKNSKLYVGTMHTKESKNA